MKNSALVECYPNPSAGFVDVRLQDGEWLESGLEVNIMNTLGVTVQTVNTSPGVKTTQINLNYLASGVYMVEVFRGPQRLGKTTIVLSK